MYTYIKTTTRSETPLQTEASKTKIHTTPHIPEHFIETLRARGIKVRARHYRWVCSKTSPWLDFQLTRISKHERKSAINAPVILQNGGETHVTVRLADGREADGIAECNVQDPYVKRLGVYIATKRALAALKAQDKPVMVGGGGSIEGKLHQN